MYHIIALFSSTGIKKKIAAKSKRKDSSTSLVKVLSTMCTYVQRLVGAITTLRCQSGSQFYLSVHFYAQIFLSTLSINIVYVELFLNSTNIAKIYI